MQRPSRRLPPLPIPGSPQARRSSYRSALLVIVILGVTSGLVGGTAASFNAQTTNPGFIATPSLLGPSPSVLTVTAGPAPAMNLTWTAATNFGTAANEYALYRANSAAATATTCPSADASYTGANGTQIYFGTGLAYTDTPGSSAAAGYLCYMLFAAFTSGGVPSAPVWISHPVAAPLNPYTDASHAAPHLPLIATAVAYKNSGAACTTTCTLDTGDIIQINFNQPTTTPAITAPNDVCILANGRILLGANGGGGNCVAASAKVGEIDPPAGCTTVCFDTGGQDDDYSATYAWNNLGGCPAIGGPFTAGTVLCITLGALTNGSNVVVKNTGWTFVPSTAANIRSNDAIVANRVAVCTTGAACEPTTATQP
jgi:hypothetical protein